MEDSGLGVPNGSVHIEDLSESKEFCINVAEKKAVVDPVACEGIIEDRPAKIIRKLSGVGGFDEDAKDLLSKIAESLGLDVLDKVSEKLTKGTRKKDTSVHDENDRFAMELDHIEHSIDNLCNGTSYKPNLVTGQLADTLKGIASWSSKSAYTDQLTRIVDKLAKTCKAYKYRRDQYEFMSPTTDEDTIHDPSNSDSATASSNFRRSSRTNEKSSRSRSYASRTSTSTGSEGLANKQRCNRSGSSRGPKHHNGRQFGPHWPQKRDGSPKPVRRRASTTVTEDTTTASSTETETETGTATESSVVSGETIVPMSQYGLRPRKSADREEREYQDFLYFLRRSNKAEVPDVVLKKVLEAFAKQDGASTEEDLFCEYLKIRLGELEPKEKRKAIYKIHKVLEQPED